MSESTTPETDPTKDPSSTDPESGRNGSAAARWILVAVVVVLYAFLFITAVYVSLFLGRGLLRTLAAGGRLVDVWLVEFGAC